MQGRPQGRGHTGLAIRGGARGKLHTQPEGGGCARQHHQPTPLPELSRPASIFGRLIKALATHLAGLPPPEKQLVVGVQAMLGITGDDRPWNGNPIDPKLWITDAQWTAYTRKMSLEYCAAFSAVGMRVLFNLENPGVGGHDVEDPHVPMRCLLCWHPAVK